ncbi:aromatic ring-hydroxylating oxygenase subunit alpha [Granulicella tundricola]|uniref:Rieske (2Fe-2S) iron-sulfur domain protein n=1 Tax=Granulicella tundricola (strain ATCC BAA-1859 / DSM 23138 / MP5ACTX9) TaxID=1198114 RepID=E8X490_GRATM|nr:aromatic ring-hydroxylating dioxygenase subunit alpha [Granulicella tundricola]ADW67150.1 Rieske (2Fe-2S) iron-sulfur domain protein [Granulicella tundricola MP5ACTX9]
MTSNLQGGPPAELIFGEWYPAGRSAGLKKGKTTTALLCGVPLLLGRKNDGTVFAMRDLCPHRGIPLSAGWFDGNEVQCKYHGWKFEPCSGQCTEIPSLTGLDILQPTKIYATSYPCEERDGTCWVYLPEAGAGRRTAELPPVPEVPKFSAKFRSAHLTADLPCNVDHGIIGLMDPAHGPFVHQAWWWRSRASIHEKTKHFEPIPGGFRISSHAPSANSAPYKLLGVYGEPITTTIDFVLPNRRYETIRAGEKWFASLTTVTPVTASTCRIDVYAAWNVFYNVPLVKTIATFFGARFVRQDQETMIEQAQGLRFRPALMLIDDADQPAKWYFALKQARLTGIGEHPLKGPVELHWRS